MPIHNYFARKGTKITAEALRLAGPVLAVEIEVPGALAQWLMAQSRQVPQPVTGLALIDTGASRTCVDGVAITGLGVNPIGTTLSATAAGAKQQSLYPARLRFPGTAIDIEFNSILGADLSGQSVGGRKIIALVGRDILSRCLLVYNGPGGFYALSY
ncbi:MAG: hypothetical protein HY721_10905 [Planctomycetes bacterium]|nr:hypothetical protein [Planctomycetota bacterium]